MISRKPYRICKHGQCNGLTRDGRYCDAHEHVGTEKDRQRELDRYKDYTRYRRDEESQAVYQSKAWKMTREYVMTRDDWLCQMCLDEQRITKADVCHHVRYLSTHPELAYDVDNLISICHRHHNMIHADD